MENNFPMREVNLSAEIKKVWGKEWAEPELEYQFSNGRKFYRKTEHAAIYETSPDF
jgi:hypothetical protein